tara:strand:- start:1892 stop:2071 length:180 start_codon:yes stop_codon:yes gene_type:complete
MPQASWGSSHWGLVGSYLRLVFDHADDTVLGRRGLAMSDPHAVSDGTAGRLNAFEMPVN